MTKTSNFTVMADQLREIREELAALAKLVHAPSHRAALQARPLDREHPDPTPVEIPGGQTANPETLEQLVARYVQAEHAAHADPNVGTFAEEDDFTEDLHDEIPLPAHFDVSDYEMEPDPQMPSTEDASQLDPPEPGAAAPSEKPPVDPAPPVPASAEATPA